MKNFEIELRYEILNASQLTHFVKQFTHAGTKRDIDIYFDNAQLELYQKGIFIRMRNERTFDIKFNRACLEDPLLPLQDYCEEYIFALPLQNPDLEKLNPLLMSLSLQPLVQADFAHFLHINKNFTLTL